MCFKTKQTSIASNTQTSGPEQWVQSAGEGIYNRASDVASKPYQPYTGQRVADFNSDFADARKVAQGMNANDNADYGAARDSFSAVAGADDAGKSVQDYMNPFLSAVLSPAIREMMLQGQQARNKIGAQAAMSGAFGDTRQALLESEQLRGEQQNVGDMTGKLMAQGFDTANAQRNAALQRILSAGTARQNLGTAEDSRKSTIAQLLAGLSDKQRGVDQAKADANYDDYTKEQKFPYEQLTWLMQMLNQTPADQTQTGTSVNTQKGTDNSGLQLAGKLLGNAVMAIPGI